MTTDYRLIYKLRLCDTKLRSFTNDVIRVTCSQRGPHGHRTDPLILNTFKIRCIFGIMYGVPAYAYIIMIIGIAYLKGFIMCIIHAFLQTKNRGHWWKMYKLAGHFLLILLLINN